ncbi:hypothetical protein FRC04_010384 [Tulasnella sp. 424]|nr:hypothetical protein FRC04_010384 [Tulasnella sp. 424]
MASNSQFARRVAEFKAPRLHKDSQEKRRADALAEQKRKRAERIQSSRNIDLFAGLSISSPKSGGASLPNDEDDEDDVIFPHQGLAQFVKMLPSASNSSLPTPSEPEILPEHQLPTAFGSTALAHSRRKRKPKNHKAKKAKKPAKAEDMVVETGKEEGNPLLANSIMYAELLEMNADLVEWNQTHLPIQQDDPTIPDGIPADLETGWVALAPIPRGKRCMAISYQAVYEGRSEEPATRTLLHSRVKGKAFLTFPSPLPPNSILDCILDDNWHQNGVLHVVDILRWRGSDFVDCEAEFRFWWRDSKLSELPKFPLPNAPRSSSQSSPPSSTPVPLFPYPVYFFGVPYYSPPISLPAFLQTLIPAARSARQQTVEVPIPKPPPPKRPRAKGKGKAKEQNANASMEIEAQEAEPSEETMEMEAVTTTGADGAEQDEFGRNSPATMLRYLQNDRVPTPPMPKTRMDTASFVSDGMLLYVSQASYQPGETPLACWIPAEPLPVQDQPADAAPAGPVPSPLDVFQSLIYRRCVKAKDALEGNGASLPNGGVIPQR